MKKKFDQYRPCMCRSWLRTQRQRQDLTEELDWLTFIKFRNVLAISKNWGMKWPVHTNSRTKKLILNV